MVEDNPLKNLPEERPTVSWTKSAYISLQKAYEKIKESSPANPIKQLIQKRKVAGHHF